MDVEVKKLSMWFKDAGRTISVFEELNFRIASGEAVAVIGESGAGKTTLLYNLGGLESPRAGDIVIGSTNITQPPKDGRFSMSAFRGKHIGFIFQFHYLFPEFDAVENVAMPLLIQRVDKNIARKRATELLERVGLSDRLTHRPGQLSGGEQQRVAVARALAAGPGLILADEPTGNLDHKTGDTITKLLREMQQEFGMTLIVVTHSHEVARSMDRVFELTDAGMSEVSL